jgi:hypothetical protein
VGVDSAIWRVLSNGEETTVGVKRGMTTLGHEGGRATTGVTLLRLNWIQAQILVTWTSS